MNAVASSDRFWLPLGNAQIIDWRHLGRDAPHRGATAWTGRVGGDSVLVRTWCEETTTHFEFAMLAYETLSGHITVRVSRPEPHRLSVQLDVDVPHHLAFSERAEFLEHPRTGLQGSVAREVQIRSGRFDPGENPSLTALQTEILECAPERALSTACGPWLIDVLDTVRTFVVDGDSAAKLPEREGDQAAAARASRTPDEPLDHALDAALALEDPPPRPPDPEPPRRPPMQAQPQPTPPIDPVPAMPAPRLFASTNAGESWEITELETYVGRSKQCPVVLKSQRVSRKHASITREEDGWFINDVGAANGIWAGSERIEREPIKDGAEYIIGDVVLTFTFS